MAGKGKQPEKGRDLIKFRDKFDYIKWTPKKKKEDKSTPTPSS